MMHNNRWVKKITLPPPSLGDNTADADRLAAALKKSLGTQTVHMDLALLKQLPARLREWNFRATAVWFKDDGGNGILAHLAEPDTADTLCGLAVDLGTTRVVLRIIDLSTGAHLGESVFDNPQIAVGPDVLARIHHVEKPDGLEQLNRLIVDGINRELQILCNRCGLSP
jgi:uncharacterized 2Fe-2S/4Fe-4S cluster protein (DUF4445 family)